MARKKKKKQNDSKLCLIVCLVSCLAVILGVMVWALIPKESKEYKLVKEALLDNDWDELFDNSFTYQEIHGSYVDTYTIYLDEQTIKYTLAYREENMMTEWLYNYGRDYVDLSLFDAGIVPVETYTKYLDHGGFVCTGSPCYYRLSADQLENMVDLMVEDTLEMLDEYGLTIEDLINAKE